MFAKAPRRTVSVWRRIRSTVSAGFRLTVVAVPEAGVNVTDAIVTWKVSSAGLAGSVSATMVTATVPVLPQLEMQMVPVLGPLQAASDKAASRRTGRKKIALLRFMWPPTTE